MRSIHVSAPSAANGKKSKNGGGVLLASKNIISPSTIPGFIELDFRHRGQCPCPTCRAKNAPPKRRRRNGSR